MTFMHQVIHRPVGITLLTLATALVGIVAYSLLSVAPLPQVDFPTIQVRALMPGASPETMATTVATPLERALGRIAGISEMTSFSSLGSTRVVIQFDLDRNIDGAARDVQAAINAARATLPTLPSNPTYRKLNPADMPIMILALTSDNLPVDQLFNVADSALGQKISQIPGVGQVVIGGGSLSAVRVGLNPGLINSQGIPLTQVRENIGSANSNLPKGTVDDGLTQWFIGANDRLITAEDFGPVVVRYQEKGSVRLSDLAIVSPGVQDKNNAGYANGKRSVILVVFRQPGANIIETVGQVREALPLLRSWMPESATLEVLSDRSPSIASSVREVEFSLLISMSLVTLVVWLFLRNGRATVIPAISVPVSLLGTFAVMYLCGFSLNHLSLMALTVATGFVVDDAIVVTENIVRHLENGEEPLHAAEKGSREVAFTVMSISISLVAIFIPIIGMDGMAGRLFREFAVTLSAAVMVSLGVSLLSTPMMCGQLLKAGDTPQMLLQRPTPLHMLGGLMGTLSRFGRRILRMWADFLDNMHEGYARSLAKVLQYKRATLIFLILTIALNIFLYIIIPKGLFPQQDTGQLRGSIRADQSISFQAMLPKFKELMDIVRQHPDVLTLGGYMGGRASNAAMVFISLKPLKERKKSTWDIMKDIQKSTAHIPGIQLFMRAMQDVRAGAREARTQYQFTLQTDDLALLREWAPKVEEAFKDIPGIMDLNSDQDTRGLQVAIDVNRDTLARYGVSFRQVDTALGLAFGQSFASTIFDGANQYRVVMELEPEYIQGPQHLVHIYVPATLASSYVARDSAGGAIGRAGNAASTFASGGQGATLVPLNVFADHDLNLTAVGVSHQNQFTAATLSFNLAEGYALSEVESAVKEKLFEIGLPSEIMANFQGTAKVFAQSVASQPMLILAAILTLYIVLGVLYESLIHPLTILSTLPSAGIGALLGLMLFGTQFTVVAFIGVLLLAGIVKKNAIMMVDFAIVARRDEGLSAEAAIFKACMLRFRPIMMTTMAAVFGAFPLLLSGGEGAALRYPLGITIVGGLIMSQILTLYTTPVVYLYLDRFSRQKKFTVEDPPSAVTTRPKAARLKTAHETV